MSALVYTNGRPVRSDHIDRTDDKEKLHIDKEALICDLVSECEWHCGPGGPLGIYLRTAALWLVLHGLSGEVVGAAESRADALFLIAERHANVARRERERQERREEWRERYYQKKGTW